MDFKIEIFNSTEKEVHAMLSRLGVTNPPLKGLELLSAVRAATTVSAGPEQETLEEIPPEELRITEPETPSEQETAQPPPPPPPPVEQASSATQVPPGKTVELDTTGLPWDKRIHTSGKQKKNNDGSWRRKRNLDDDIYASVVTELRGVYPLIADTAPDEDPPVPPAPPAPPAPGSETVDPNKVPTNYLEFTRFLRSLGFNDVASQSDVVKPHGITSVALLSAMAKDEPGIYARLHAALIG